MRAKLRALGRVEAALEQRAKNRRLDRRPILVRGIAKELQFIGVERQHVIAIEQPAVEARDAAIAKIRAFAHGPKQRPRPFRKLAGVADGMLEAIAHQFGGQQLDVFGKQCKQHLHEKRCDLGGRKATLFEELRDLGKAPCDLLGDRRRALGWPQLLGVGEHQAQQFARADIGQIRIGEALDARAIASEGDMHLVVGDVAGNQDGRIIEVFFIQQELLVGGAQIGVFILGLVFPGEVVAHPNIGKASTPAGLGQRLLEAIERPAIVGLVWRWYAEQAAQINKMLLNRRAFVECGFFLFGNELSGAGGVAHG